jgi:DNA-binding transcriptional LysR family regulator
MLLQKASASTRYAGTRLSGYINRVSADEGEQMSAVTFHLDNGLTYVSFRGTDDTITGWKEDFHLGFMEETAGQRMAAEYLSRQAAAVKGELFVGGHSKGGNFAVYAAAFCEEKAREKIRRVYTNDGPGFLETVTHTLQYRDILQKMGSVGRTTLSEKLRVSAINSVGNYLLPPVLDSFLEKYPHIHLTVQDMEAEKACLSIIRGQTDMAFSTAKVQNDQIVATPFINDPFTLICAADAPYQDGVTQDQLSLWDEVYIKWSADYEFWHQSAFGSHYVPQICLELMGQIELFVAKSGKWALVPRSIAAQVCKGNRIRSCAPAFVVPDRSIYILRHRDNAESDTIKLFMDTAREVFTQRDTQAMLING